MFFATSVVDFKRALARGVGGSGMGARCLFKKGSKERRNGTRRTSSLNNRP